MMQLRMVHLARNNYGDDKGLLKGSVEVTTLAGEIKLHLDEEKAEKILALIADQLVENTQEIAQSITSSIINHKPALEDKS